MPPTETSDIVGGGQGAGFRDEIMMNLVSVLILKECRSSNELCDQRAIRNARMETGTEG